VQNLYVGRNNGGRFIWREEMKKEVARGISQILMCQAEQLDTAQTLFEETYLEFLYFYSMMVEAIEDKDAPPFFLVHSPRALDTFKRIENKIAKNEIKMPSDFYRDKMLNK